MNVVILTAGAPKKNNSHPSLYEVGGKPLICHQIDVINSVWDRANILTVLGHSANEIIPLIKQKSDFVHIKNYNEVSACKGIHLSCQYFNLENLTPNFLVIYGNLLFEPSIIDKPYNKSFSIGIRRRSYNHDKLGISEIDNQVGYFGYGLKYAWSQIIYLAENEMKIANRLLDRDNLYYKRLPSELYNDIIDDGGSFDFYKTRYTVREI